MPTREIPREQWIKFFDAFSKQHQGWIATVNVMGSDLGDQEQSVGLPLVGLSADTKDRESRVEVILGGRLDADVTRIINHPKRVMVEQVAEGSEREQHDSVEIEGEDGTTTLLQFRHIPPEETERQLPRSDAA